jgi:hypothetical protein
MKGKELIVTRLATFQPDHHSQGIASSLIIIRVALGLSNTPSGGLCNVGTPPVSTHVHLGNSPAAFSDAGQHFLSSEISMSQMRLKSLGERLGSVETVENASV